MCKKKKKKQRKMNKKNQDYLITMFPASCYKRLETRHEEDAIINQFEYITRNTICFKLNKFHSSQKTKLSR